MMKVEAVEEKPVAKELAEEEVFAKKIEKRQRGGGNVVNPILEEIDDRQYKIEKLLIKFSADI